jgi:hypothetical protein
MSQNWMASIPGKTNIFDILLPGTHDSGAWNTDSYFYKTQRDTQNISQQFHSGIRAFDLRANDDKSGRLPIRHGPIDLKQNLPTALETLASLVKDHPSETVIVIIKAESEASQSKDIDTPNFTEAIARLTSQPPFFTSHEHFREIAAKNDSEGAQLTTQNPKDSSQKLNYNIPIRHLRGKILVIYRGDGDMTQKDATIASYKDPQTIFTGIDAVTSQIANNEHYGQTTPEFTNGILYQDRYKEITKAGKLYYFEEFYRQANKGRQDHSNQLWINHSSANGIPNRRLNPNNIATYMNRAITEAVDPRTDSLNLIRDGINMRGIIGSDFISKKTTDPIINYNNHLKEPSARNDLVLGSIENDSLKGKAGQDFLYGYQGNDTLKGGRGNDTLHGGPGNNLLLGGKGTDTVEFEGGRKDYLFTSGSAPKTIMATVAADSGEIFTHQLTSIEKVSFADGSTYRATDLA